MLDQPDIDVATSRRLTWRTLRIARPRLRAPNWDLILTDRWWGLALFVLLLSAGARMIAHHPEMIGDATDATMVFGIGSAASMYLLTRAWWRALVFHMALLFLLLGMIDLLGALHIYLASSEAVANVLTDLLVIVFAGGIVTSGILAFIMGASSLAAHLLSRLLSGKSKPAAAQVEVMLHS